MENEHHQPMPLLVADEERIERKIPGMKGRDFVLAGQVSRRPKPTATYSLKHWGTSYHQKEPPGAHGASNNDVGDLAFHPHHSPQFPFHPPTGPHHPAGDTHQDGDEDVMTLFTTVNQKDSAASGERGQDSKPRKRAKGAPTVLQQTTLPRDKKGGQQHWNVLFPDDNKYGCDDERDVGKRPWWLSDSDPEPESEPESAHSGNESEAEPRNPSRASPSLHSKSGSASRHSSVSGSEHHKHQALDPVARPNNKKATRPSNRSRVSQLGREEWRIRRCNLAQLKLIGEYLSKERGKHPNTNNSDGSICKMRLQLEDQLNALAGTDGWKFAHKEDAEPKNAAICRAMGWCRSHPDGFLEIIEEKNPKSGHMNDVNAIAASIVAENQRKNAEAQAFLPEGWYSAHSLSKFTPTQRTAARRVVVLGGQM